MSWLSSDKWLSSDECGHRPQGMATKSWENHGYIKLISSSMLRERCPKIRKAPALSEDRGGSRTTEAPTGGRAARPAAPPPASTRTALCAHSTVCAQHCVRPGLHAPGRPSGLRTQASHDPWRKKNVVGQTMIPQAAVSKCELIVGE